MADRRTRVDEAIDRAVRDMVQHDARPGFRRRVLGRLEAPARRVWWVPGLAAAAAAIVVTAVALTRPADSTRPATPGPQQAHHATPPAPGEAIPAAPAVVVAPAARVENAPRAPRRPSTATPPPAVVSDPQRLESIFGPRTNRVAATSIPQVDAPLLLPEIRFVRVTLDSIPVPPIPVIR